MCAQAGSERTRPTWPFVVYLVLFLAPVVAAGFAASSSDRVSVSLGMFYIYTPTAVIQLALSLYGASNASGPAASERARLYRKCAVIVILVWISFPLISIVIYDLARDIRGFSGA
ncbi:MAG: hypothetical protein U1D55_19100 [Phycisphaerae bacterium]